MYRVNNRLGKLTTFDVTHLSYGAFKMVGIFSEAYMSKKLLERDGKFFSMHGCVMFRLREGEWTPCEYYDLRHLYSQEVKYLRAATEHEIIQAIKYMKVIGRRYCHKTNGVITIFTLRQIKKLRKNAQST